MRTRILTAATLFVAILAANTVRAAEDPDPGTQPQAQTQAPVAQKTLALGGGQQPGQEVSYGQGQPNQPGQQGMQLGEERGMANVLQQGRIAMQLREFKIGDRVLIGYESGVINNDALLL